MSMMQVPSAQVVEMINYQFGLCRNSGDATLVLFGFRALQRLVMEQLLLSIQNARVDGSQRRDENELS